MDVASRLLVCFPVPFLSYSFPSWAFSAPVSKPGRLGTTSGHAHAAPVREPRIDVRVVIEEREEYGNTFENRGPQLGLNSSPVVKKPSADRFELRFLLGWDGILAGGILRLPLNALRFQHSGETWCEGCAIAVGFGIEPEMEWLEVFRKLQIFFFPEQRGIGFDQSTFGFFDSAFEQIRIDRAFIDIEKRDVIESDFVQQDDEFDEVGVGLLPERFLASPEEIVEQRSDVVRERVSVEVSGRLASAKMKPGRRPA